jgi:hypothetical protein
MKTMIASFVLIAIAVILLTTTAPFADTQTVRITVIPRPVDANYIVAVGHSVTIYTDPNCSLVYKVNLKAVKGITRVDLKVGNVYKRVDITVK